MSYISCILIRKTCVNFLPGIGSMSTSSNAHTLLKEQLEDHLNRHKNLAQLIHILHETYTPLMSISKLPSIPHLGVLPVVSIKKFKFMIGIAFIKFIYCSS